MARFVIKESEIRNYVRSLIREAGRKKIDFHPDLVNGAFALEKELCKPGGERWVEDFFNEKGVKKPTKPRFKNTPYRMIDYNTGELANADEMNDFVDAMRKKGKISHKDKVADNWHNSKMDKSDDAQANRDAMKNFASQDDDSEEELVDVNDIPVVDDDEVDDEYTQKWLALSNDDRMAASKEVINARKAKQAADVERYRQMENDLPRYASYPSPDEIRDRIAMLKDKQAALGDHNMVTDKKWREYDYLIKDCEKILNKYYGGVNPTDSSDEMADEVVKNSLADDLSSAEEFKDTDFNAFATNQSPKQTYDDYDSIDDETEDDDDNRSHKRDFKDAERNGFFNYDDDWEF